MAQSHSRKHMTETLELLKQLYNSDDGGIGGYAHIVTDDGNIEDANIDSCLEDAKKNISNMSQETVSASIRCLEALRKLTEDEREVVLLEFWKRRLKE